MAFPIRQVDREHGSFARSTLQRDRTIVRLDDSACHRKPEPDAGYRIARYATAVEQLEYLLVLFGRNPQSLISHSKNDRSILAVDTDFDSAPFGEYLIALLTKLFMTCSIRSGSQFDVTGCCGTRATTS